MEISRVAVAGIRTVRPLVIDTVWFIVFLFNLYTSSVGVVCPAFVPNDIAIKNACLSLIACTFFSADIKTVKQ